MTDPQDTTSSTADAMETDLEQQLDALLEQIEREQPGVLSGDGTPEGKPGAAVAGFFESHQEEVEAAGAELEDDELHGMEADFATPEEIGAAEAGDTATAAAPTPQGEQAGSEDAGSSDAADDFLGKLAAAINGDEELNAAATAEPAPPRAVGGDGVGEADDDLEDGEIFDAADIVDTPDAAPEGDAAEPEQPIDYAALNQALTAADGPGDADRDAAARHENGDSADDDTVEGGTFSLDALAAELAELSTNKPEPGRGEAPASDPAESADAQPREAADATPDEDDHADDVEGTFAAFDESEVAAEPSPAPTGGVSKASASAETDELGDELASQIQALLDEAREAEGRGDDAAEGEAGDPGAVADVDSLLAEHAEDSMRSDLEPVSAFLSSAPENDPGETVDGAVTAPTDWGGSSFDATGDDVAAELREREATIRSAAQASATEDASDASAKAARQSLITAMLLCRLACAWINRPLTRLPKPWRDLVGWIALSLVFNFSVMMVYAIVT